MAVYKRPDSKYYWTDFFFEGKRIQRSTKCKRKSDAQNFEASLKHQLNFKRIDLDAEPDRSLTFEQGCREFFGSLVGQVAASTVRRYETASKAPMRLLAAREIEGLD